MNEFKKEDIYNAKIAAAAKALSDLCYRSGIPMFFSAAIANTDDGTTVFKSEYVSAARVGATLLDDQLCRHVNVMNGFTTVMPSKLEEIDIG